MADKTPAGLVAHARAQLGYPYIYAFWGNALTLDYIRWSQRTYPDVWSKSRFAERDTRARSQIGKFARAYDCAGLIKSYWMQENPTAQAKYIKKYDQSAHGLYQCCKVSEKIGTLPKGTEGALVFIWSKERGCMSHVGIYDGKGRVIEAQGFSTGVIERPLSAGSWTHWGLLDWLEYPTAPKHEKPAPRPKAPSVGTLTLADLRLKPGDLARIKDGTAHYYPGGPKIPTAAWFWKSPVFQVEKISADGRTPNIKGGEPCVLLGEGAGANIGTWCALKFLTKEED